MAMSEDELKAVIDEEMERFREDGYFTRLRKMFKGLGMPHETKEYKIAAIELQRQLAPVLAFLIVGLLVLTGLLIAIFAKKPEQQTFQIAALPPEQNEDIVEETPPETPPEPPKEPVVTDDIPIDVETVGTPSTVVNPNAASVASVQPSPNDAVQMIKSPVKLSSMAGARDAGRRGEMTRGGPAYGDPLTEAAVMRALRWLKYTQAKDGAWHVNPGHPTMTGKDKGVKNPNGCVLANTAFALLTFLAHGETTGSAEFGDTVRRSIEYLMKQAHTDGQGTFKFRGADEHEYAFLIATYALSEAYGMMKNPEMKEVAEQGIKRIIASQTAHGGWEYKLSRSGTEDISLGGWAIQAMMAAKLAGIHPDGLEECISKAMHCLRTRNWNRKEACFTYRPGNSRRYYLSPVGCLAMQLLGYRNDPCVFATLKLMKTWQPEFSTSKPPNSHYAKSWNAPQYYMYYATQCKFQAGMQPNASAENFELWKVWNGQMKALYPKAQRICPQKIKDTRGKEQQIGYWMNSDHWSTRPVMDTCLCALQLMVYYRYLPTTASTVKETAIEEAAEQAAKEADDVAVDVVGADI